MGNTRVPNTESDFTVLLIIGFYKGSIILCNSIIQKSYSSAVGSECQVGVSGSGFAGASQ